MIVDFILIFSLLSAVALGYIRGFSKNFFSLIIFICSIALAVVLYNTVGDAVLQSEFGEKIHRDIAQSTAGLFSTDNEKGLETIPYLSSISKVVFGKNSFLDFEKLSEIVADKSVRCLSSVVVIVIVMCVVKVFSSVLKKITGSINRLPVIGTIDSFLGIFCGLVRGIINFAVTFVFIFFLQFIPTFSMLQEQFNNSVVVLLINDFIF